MLASLAGQALPLRGGDACFDPHIKSIQLHKEGAPLVEPVVVLGSGEQVWLTFDDLSSERRYFTYRLVLCDADWHPSDLPYTDYIAGFWDDNIADYNSSFNTLTPYTFFSLRLPNENTQFTLSGNYKIEVMDADYPNDILFSKGFAVVEHTLPFAVQCKVRQQPLAGQPECRQRLDFKVDYTSVNIQNPRTEVKVRITQNGYLPPAVPPEPVFILPTGIDYAMYDKNLYAGGAEYRKFDISSFEYRSLRVRKIQVEEGQYYVLLDEDAVLRQYIASTDINGSYIVKNARYEENSNTESDYAQVLFTLLTHRPLQGKVYVFGEFTNWQLSDDYLMLYSAERSTYELTLPVKQGFYNYRYLLVDEDGNVDFGALEGCSHETENSYGIYVYYRSPLDRHDRLMNVTTVGLQNSK
ncbi:hypothetical protein AGMMS4956_02410 [Bacteroidia bacterium]|nr:hypothetical protein AGMMS4956_02410 [Bacteroidia bacterium]